MIAEKLAPSVHNSARVADLGPKAVSRLVTARLARLPNGSATLARAVAVLGDRCDLTIAAQLAGQDTATAFKSAGALERMEILHIRRQNSQLDLSFVHPLIFAAVYESVGLAERVAAHRRSAQLLFDTGANPELVAAHILRVPPNADGTAVAALRKAADQAVLRGAPQTAFTYLERALQEPPATADEQAIILHQAGATAQLVDVRKSVKYLSKALDVAPAPESRSIIVDMLGRMLFALGRNREAVEVYEKAIADLHDDQRFVDQRQRLQAGLLNVTVANEELHEMADTLIAQLPREAVSDGVGGRCLDALVGWHTAIATTTPEPALSRTRRALADRVLIDHANGSEAFADAAWVSIAADSEEILPILDAALADAHRHGMTFATAVAACFRALLYYRHGSLSDAHADATQSKQLCDTAHLDVLRPLTAAFLADTLIEQGQLNQAQHALDWAFRTDLPHTAAQWYWAHASRGRLLVRQGNTEEGVNLLLDCGGRFHARGWRNSSLFSWRPDAALALHALNRTAEAYAMATEDLHFARQWGAPWALGKALHVSGLIATGRERLEHLQEAVSVLRDSPARLEFAKALAGLGAALRAVGRRTDARPILQQALDLTVRCGAAPLIDNVRSELAAAGGRPRRTGLTGPGSLTPSEQRVAKLAANGDTNRQIAQALFVTQKTVEVHLSAAYRKLGITTRTQLQEALDSD
ncbi:LuxR C-terminal-related transcriptional regulator [Streptomyces collinus]|uniref:helix-turn-helix transcriptional regulator n=1 Tax=Streptomyces collinus TaxID=42684 RepID=UPI0036E5E863